MDTPENQPVTSNIAAELEAARAELLAGSAQPDPQRAAGSGGDPAAKPSPEASGTAQDTRPAAEKPDGQPTTEAKPQDKPSDKPEAKPDAKAPERKPTRFEQRQAEIRTQIEQAKAEKAAADKRTRELDERERMLAEREKQAQKPKVTPEQALKYAESQDARAKELEERADRLESGDKPDFDKADKLREEARELRITARQGREYASTLQQEQPAPGQPTDITARWKAHGEATFKAFPDVLPGGKANGEMVALLAGQDFQPEALPAVAQWAMDRVKLKAAEAAAGRVPELEKTVNNLQKRVSELQALTAPGGGGVQPANPAQGDDSHLSTAEQLQRERDRLAAMA